MKAEWRKSTYSTAQGNCVEAAGLRRVVAVRDSKDPDGPKLTFAPAEWRTFANDVKAGGHDLP
jgi:Domain of unknown function (DUF397)